MSMQTITNTKEMETLGIHPEPLCGYETVSPEPHDFVMGKVPDQWIALHLASWKQWPGSKIEMVEVCGIAVFIQDKKNQETDLFPLLMDAWRCQLSTRTAF